MLLIVVETKRIFYVNTKADAMQPALKIVMCFDSCTVIGRNAFHTCEKVVSSLWLIENISEWDFSRA